MPASDLKLCGREGEMSLLRSALEGANGGRGRIVVVSGEPGIGKTALAGALADWANDQGARVVWGRAWEFSEAPPYFPLLPCLRALGIELGSVPDQPPEAPFAAWQRVLSALARAAESSSLVWIIEDVHAADLLTWDLLAFLSPALPALRTLVVLTLRREDPRLSPRAKQRLTRMQRDGSSVELGPLGPEDVATVARSHARRSLSPLEAVRLTEWTGGNPFFVIECARALRHSTLAGSDVATLPPPPTVRQVVAERVASLPEPTRRALTLAAIVGREFSAAMLARMTGALPARIIDDVRAALLEHLVTETAPGLFAFGHAIVRDAIEDATPAEERARLHVAAQVALATAGDSPEVLVERARHALSGTSPADEAQAIAIAMQAAELCERQGAFDRAHVIYQRLERARRSSVTSRLAPSLELLRAGRAAMEAGRREDALRICDEAVARARAEKDAAFLARAALLVGTELRPAVVDTKLIALLEEALDMLGEDWPALRCKVLARLAAATQPAPDPGVPVALAREAIAVARGLGDNETLLEVLYFGGSALVVFAPIEERIRVATELLSRALAAHDDPRALRALARLAMDHAESGDFGAFDSSVDQMLELASAVDHPRHRWRPLLFASMRALALGRAGESDRHLVEVDALAALTDDPAFSYSLQAHRTHRARLLHHDDELRAELVRLADEGAVQGVTGEHLIRGLLRASVYTRLEDQTAAATELARLEPRAASLERMPFFLAMLAEAYAFAGSEAQRTRARSLALLQTSSDVVGGHVPIAYDGPWLRYIGLLDAALGDVSAAEDRLRSALALSAGRGHRAWIAQLDYDLGQTLRRAGRAEQANVAFREASAIADELGMTGLAARAGARTVPSMAGEVRASGPIPTGVRLVREGRLWRVEHGENLCRIPDSRGMQLLARLLDRPGEEIHVLALASDDGAALAETSAGEHLDARASRAYQDRLDSLAVQASEARSHNDLGRLERIRMERDSLDQELSRAFGLGGRSRHAGSASERARVNVRRRIKNALARVGEVDVVLGCYLAKKVRTGTYCCFRP